LLAALAARAEAPLEPGFIAWLEGVQDEALRRGISPRTWQAVQPGLRPIERVLELDQKQPEFVDTFWNYLDARVNPRRIADGEKLLAKHRGLLQKIEAEYGVPAPVLVAFWGLETHYGKFTGRFPVTAALATLAYDARRTRFFRNELLDALAILEAGHIPPQHMLGSWAGAMGQIQFMPSTFLRHAVDGDGDGRKDIWGSLDDAFASAANYLRANGWQPGLAWGQAVRLPDDFPWHLARLDVKKTWPEWASLGVQPMEGAPLPEGGQPASILLPQGHAGPAFLVYANFEVMLSWNRSVNYVLAVGHLADRLSGGPELTHGRAADNRRLSREQAIELQQRLLELGLNVGATDGVLGTRTRDAIRAYQRSASLPADGYPSLPLLERLRAGAGPGTSQAALPTSDTPL